MSSKLRVGINTPFFSCGQEYLNLPVDYGMVYVFLPVDYTVKNYEFFAGFIPQLEGINPLTIREEWIPYS